MSHKIQHIRALRTPSTSMDTHQEPHKTAAQLHPLQINTKTGEPYLALPAPHSNIIITPFRLNGEDEKFNIEYMNNIEVVKWLSGPPFPYNQIHAQEWIQKTFANSQKLLEEIYQSPPGSLINGCPVSILREVQEDGRDILIGDCSIHPWAFEEILVPEDNQEARAENEARAVGDPLKVWAFGDYLAPSHHGKGIMSLAIKTLIEQWIIPRMNVNTLKVSVFTHNIASRRVFEKNGFVLWKTIENCRQVAEGKGGGVIGIHVLRRDIG